MAREASRRMGVAKGILDLSLAPTPAEGDSVAEILEAIGVGTVRRSGHHGRARHAQRRREEGRRHGHAPASAACPARSFPCREDAGMIRAAESGALSPGEARGHDLRLLASAWT